MIKSLSARRFILLESQAGDVRRGWAGRGGGRPVAATQVFLAGPHASPPEGFSQVAAMVFAAASCYEILRRFLPDLFGGPADKSLALPGVME
jgi:hypothetical protein